MSAKCEIKHHLVLRWIETRKHTNRMDAHLSAREDRMERMPSRERMWTEARDPLTGNAVLDSSVQMASKRFERSMRQSRFMNTSCTNLGWLQKSKMACMGKVRFVDLFALDFLKRDLAC